MCVSAQCLSGVAKGAAGGERRGAAGAAGGAGRAAGRAAGDGGGLSGGRRQVRHGRRGAFLPLPWSIGFSQLRLHGQEDVSESAEAEQGEEQEAEAAAEAEGAEAEAVRRVVARKGRPFGGGKLDLKFNKGDVLVVERQDDDIWLYGFVEAKPEAKGRFPSNLVYR